MQQNNQNKVPKIMVGTPCYNGMLHQDYVKSVIEFSQMGIPITYVHIGNESLITRGRNAIVSLYYANKDKFDYLLFLDADVYLPPSGLIKLIQSNKDVVAAPVPMKGLGPNAQRHYNVGEILERGEIAKVEHVGTAVFMLSTKAVELLINECKKENKVYNSNSLSRGDAPINTQYDVFSVGVIDGQYYSEDFFVCRKLRQLGFDINLCTTIDIRHNGMYVF